MPGKPPLSTFWLQSTAPIDVDRRQFEQPAVPPSAAPTISADIPVAEATAAPSSVLESMEVTPISASKADLQAHQTREAMRDMVASLMAAHRRGLTPRVVITVHGFNNPLNVVEGRYEDAAKAVNGDAAIADAGAGLVCIGYRWPSEAVPVPLHSSLSAMPTLLRFLSGAALGTAALGALWPFSGAPLAGFLGRAMRVLALVMLGLPLSAVMLRTVGYYRDSYRAAHYGVPDLVEFLRHLHRQLELSCETEADKAMRVDLSFIGHSMGAFVVTSAVRVLSDAFDPNSIGSLDPNEPDKRPSPHIGTKFSLAQLVLVSPDIPAEALMMRRANFLASSLRRFRESYLFSNEADVVLRLISTLANYFSFPTLSRANGFRLGNLEVLGRDAEIVDEAADFGIVNLELLRGWQHAGELGSELTPEQLGAMLSRLRVGDKTLQHLNRRYNAAQNQTQLPALFTCIDCTDYHDQKLDSNGKIVAADAPYLSFGQRKARLTGWDNLRLLASYAAKGVDVHSGYFDGPIARGLIYRLACLGFEATSEAHGGLDSLSQKCGEHGLQVLLSPERMRNSEMVRTRAS